MVAVNFFRNNSLVLSKIYPSAILANNFPDAFLAMVDWYHEPMKKLIKLRPFNSFMTEAVII